jgi:hypothetical protein
MAKIVKTESAPTEAAHYTFASGEFDLGGRKKFFETEDLTLIAEAVGHPDLTVETEVIEVTPTFREQIAPEDDPLSAANSVAAAAAQDADDTAAVTETVELDVTSNEKE